MRRWILLLLLAGFACPTLAYAGGNPIARHDGLRTGTVSGTSNLNNPEVSWQYYLGGALSAFGLIVEDLDGDGSREILYLTGGRLVAVRSSGAVMWSGGPFDLNQLVAVTDLDNDGTLEIAAASRTNAYVFEATTGDVEWKEPDGEMGTLGSLRVADLSGDGLDELIILECGCCGVNSGNPGYVYGFAGGTQAANLLWEFPFVRCGGGRSLTIFDADGDNNMEVLVGDSRELVLLDGLNGAEIARSPDLTAWTQLNNCTALDLDATPGDELVCILSSSLNVGENLRRTWVLDYNESTGTLDVLWGASVAPDAGEVLWVDLVADLDLDGRYELIYAAQSDGITWETVVVDALDGTELVNLPNEIIAGTAAVESGRQLLLTSRGTQLKAYAFNRAAAAPLTQRWSLPDRAPIEYPDRGRYARQRVSSQLLVNDFDGDGVDDLLTRTVGPDAAIYAYNTAGSMPVEIASFDYPDRFEPLNHWLIPPLNQPYPQVAVARNDGYLTVFDDTLTPIDIGANGGVPGLRIGGYYATGRWRDLRRGAKVASLAAGEPDGIVVLDSRGALIRLDPADGGIAVKPNRVWQRSNMLAATIVEGLDAGETGLACFALQEPVTDPPSYRLEVASPIDGSTSWSLPIESAPINDIIPANLDGDATPDLVVMWGDGGDTLQRTRGYAGVDGTTLWDSVPLEAGAGRQPAGQTVHDFTGDGIDDIYMAGAGLRILDGTDGTEILQTPASLSYAMTILTNTDADPELEAVVTASNHVLRLYDDDFTTILWSSADDDRPYPYAAVADCGTHKTLVSTSWQNLARLKLTHLNGSNASTYTTSVLAGGTIHVDELAAATAGAFMGQLTSVMVHENLAGDGAPVAVVGSPDGWLYAVDACDGTLRFAVDFGVAVGESVFADTDGDGFDELIVSAADGYLYGLREFVVEAPGTVRDLQPGTPPPGTDVNTVVTTDTLAASWDAVTGATEYEFAIILSRNGELFSNGWQRVSGTDVEIGGLPLVDNESYAFAVRAVTSNGKSRDVRSDGARVGFPIAAAEPDMVASDVRPDDVAEPLADTSATLDGDVATDTALAMDEANDIGTIDSGSVLLEGGDGSGGGSDGCCRVNGNQSPTPPPVLPMIVLLALGLVAGVRRRF